MQKMIKCPHCGREIVNGEDFSLDGAAGRSDPVPYQRIVALYHEKLPMLPRVAKLTEARRSAIRARWKSGELPDLETWSKFFETIAESKFLTGRSSPVAGRKTFVADLEWITKESNFVKIWEGRYA